MNTNSIQGFEKHNYLSIFHSQNFSFFKLKIEIVNTLTRKKKAIKF